jgi:hypothetical protein
MCKDEDLVMMLDLYPDFHSKYGVIVLDDTALSSSSSAAKFLASLRVGGVFKGLIVGSSKAGAIAAAGLGGPVSWSNPLESPIAALKSIHAELMKS